MASKGILIRPILLGLSIVGVLVCEVGEVAALPFNDDMVMIQPANGRIMRELPPHSVPLGSLESQIAGPEAARQMTNPVQASENSIASGRRLFSINCTPCHGSYKDGEYIVSSLAAVGMPPINLAEKRLVDQPDGHFFSYIHFGGAIMPPYGWKFSIKEHWDIVNYIRQIQQEN
jgi:mono/diheme cytochrome c family protein